jgi:hypothetical protein
MAAAALPVGKAFADLLRCARLPRPVRFAQVAFVYLASLLYCIGLDLELLSDTRYRAERWLARRVKPDDGVAALAQPAYAPRVHMLNCRFAYVDERPKDDRVVKAMTPLSNYLVLCEKESRDPECFDRRTLRGLLTGSYRYRVVAQFTNLYLCPRMTVFALAGWPVERSQMISPGIIILKRQDEVPASREQATRPAGGALNRSR